MRFAKGLKIAVAFLLCAVIGLFSSCMGTEDFVQTVFLSSDVRGAYVISPEDHFCVFTPSMRLCESDGLSLYFDGRTGNAGVYDDAHRLLWSAMPTSDNRTAAVLSVEAFNGTATYVLNSQDHSAAFGTVESEPLENGVRVTFTMADREETANKQPEALTAGDVYVRIPLELTLVNGRLTASTDLSRAVCAPGLILYNVSILPHFGAIMENGKTVLPGSASSSKTASPSTEKDASAQETAPEKTDVPTEETADAPAAASADDFILLPDGCGAVVYPLPLSFRYPEVDLCVYGSDDSLGRVANVGAFGARTGNGAFVCTLTEGAELAVIRTLRENGAGTVLYPVYAFYNVTPAFNNNGEMAYGVTYAGRLSQTYAFLSGDSADAAGMACAVRELLVYAGLLSAAPLENAGYPVNVAVTGSVEGTRDTLLTDMEQAEALLSQLRAKGLDRVNLVLNGFLTGGSMKNAAAASRLSSASGSRKALGSLCEYAGKQGYAVYLAKDLLTAARGTALRDLTGKKKTFTANNPFPSAGKESYEERFVSWSEVNENAAAFLSAMEKTGATGFALSDLGTGLCGDYASRATDRLYVSGQLAEIAASYAAVRPLLVNGANCNALRCADVITGMPCYPAVSESAYYRATPFLPMLLHGSYCYSGSPVVSAETDKLALLRAVEYGCAPYFSWTGASRSVNCFENQLPACAAFCTRAARELGDLSGLRMTDHYAIAEGVFCTEYGSGIRVYVNYNNYSVAVGTVSVPPYDYLRID